MHQHNLIVRLKTLEEKFGGHDDWKNLVWLDET
jgi:hypothetical protein